MVAPHRYLGLKGGSDQAKEEIKFSPCPVSSEGEQVTFKVDYNGKPCNFTAEQVVASFMTHLYSTIQHNNL